MPASRAMQKSPPSTTSRTAILADEVGIQSAGGSTERAFTARRIEGHHAIAVDARSSHKFPRHTHDAYGIGLMRSGGQRSWSGRGRVEAGPGDLITVNPGEVHDGEPVGATRSWSMLYLSLEKMHSIFLDLREGRCVEMEFVAPVVHDRRAAPRFESAYAACTGVRDGADAAEEQLVLLIATMRPDAVNRTILTPGALAQVKEQLDDDPVGPHPLARLAQVTGLSKFQTLRGFARFTGFTPHAYLVQRRLDRAVAAIRKGDTLADAAATGGFSDQSHFHRAFVRRYGLTPGAYASAAAP